jgi:hypothetical protein
VAPPKRPTAPGGRPSSGGTITGRDLALFNAIHNFKVPVAVRLKLTLFRTASATRAPNEEDIPAYMQRLVDGASKALAPHGMSLDLLPAASAGGVPAMTPLPYSGTVDFPSGDINTVRSQAHAALDAPARLPVIVCPFRNALKDDPRNAYGVTMGVEAGQTGAVWVAGGYWLPFVMINSKLLDSDGMTLLHEMGHAARLAHEDSRGTELNFMNGSGQAPVDDAGKPKARIEMLCCQVMKLAGSYFADPIWTVPPDQKKNCPWTDGCRRYELMPRDPGP